MTFSGADIVVDSAIEQLPEQGADQLAAGDDEADTVSLDEISLGDA